MQTIRLAFLITAYHKQEQLELLLSMLGGKFGHENIFVHVDRKSSIDPSTLREHVDEALNVVKEYDVHWGGFNQLRSILRLIRMARARSSYDFMILLSGQDMPVVDADTIVKTLSSSVGRSYIDCFQLPDSRWNYRGGLGRVQWFWFMDLVARFRGVQRLHKISHYLFDRLNIRRPSSRSRVFYGGSDWWMLPGEVASFCVDQFDLDERLRACMKYSFIPTEMFFQTVIMNSRFRESVCDQTLRYIPWSTPEIGRPDIIDFDHVDAIAESGALFARKFDIDENAEAVHHYQRLFSSEFIVR